MKNLKMGNREAIRNAGKRFEKFYKQPVSKRIADFLREEGRKERAKLEEEKKKSARPNSNEDLGT
jgi:hypothetical protein